MTAFARSLGLETNGQQLRGLEGPARPAGRRHRPHGRGGGGEGGPGQHPVRQRLRPVVPEAGRPAGAVAVHRPAERGVLPEPGPARRPARRPGRRRPGVVVDGPGRVRVAGPAAATGCRRASRSSWPGPRCTSSSGRGTSGSGTSAGGSCRPSTRSGRSTRRARMSADDGGMTLEHSPPPVPQKTLAKLL